MKQLLYKVCCSFFEGVKRREETHTVENLAVKVWWKILP